MPEFHDREAEHQKWKAAVLSGEIQLEDIDITPLNQSGRAKPTKAPSALPVAKQEA